MKITSLASGSSGNCYHINDGQTSLLIECGLPFTKIKESLNYTTSDLSGVLISHEHGDHSKAAKDLCKAGIDVYTTRGTAEAIGIDKSYRWVPITKMVEVEIGTLTVVPFEVVHDAADPVGFMIDSSVTGDRLVFLTDTVYSKYRFAGMTILMIECNYDLKTLNKNDSEGVINSSLRNRVRRSHMGLDQVIELLQANDLTRLKRVYLMHLSNLNSDEELMKRRVQEVTGVLVEVL